MANNHDVVTNFVPIVFIHVWYVCRNIQLCSIILRIFFFNYASIKVPNWKVAGWGAHAACKMRINNNQYRGNVLPNLSINRFRLFSIFPIFSLVLRVPLCSCHSTLFFIALQQFLFCCFISLDRLTSLANR